MSIRSLSRFPARIALGTCLLLSPTASASSITFTESGLSAAGTPLLVSATIDTAADVEVGGPNTALRITLKSFGAPSVAKADILSSLYFNLVDPVSGIRPTLTYLSGSGQAFEVHSGGNDTPVSWTPQTWTTSGGGESNPSDLVATEDFDEGWQFKKFTPPPGYPFLGFGLGTVGNSNIGDFLPGATATFDGKVVRGNDPSSMINLGIYSVGGGVDIDPDGGLDGHRLIRGVAVFTFSSDMPLDTVTTEWLQGDVTFGFGTGPDTVLLPEPGTLPMLATAGLFAVAWVSRRRMRRRGTAA